MSAQVRVRHPFSFLALIGRGTFRRLFRTVRLLRLNGILRHHTPFKVSLFLFRLLPFLPYYIIAISSALKIFPFFRSSFPSHLVSKMRGHQLFMSSLRRIVSAFLSGDSFDSNISVFSPHLWSIRSVFLNWVSLLVMYFANVASDIFFLFCMLEL